MIILLGHYEPSEGEQGLLYHFKTRAGGLKEECGVDPCLESHSKTHAISWGIKRLLAIASTPTILHFESTKHFHIGYARELHKDTGEREVTAAFSRQTGTLVFREGL
jgi:hypothetical protein